LKRKALHSFESFFIPYEIPSQLYQENEQIENIMSALVGAPLSHKAGLHQFYLRSCYQSYYDELMQSLFCQTKNEKDVTSVTRSPGIRKSMFYLSFLNTYLSRNPGESLITASFSRD
jgi:hypothetical protein